MTRRRTVIRPVVIIRAAAVLCALATFPAALLAQGSARPDARTREALERLRASAPGRIDARFTPGGGAIRTLAGALAPARTGSPQEVAARFLGEERALFGLPEGLADLTLRGVRSSPGGTHVGFDQQHAGLPVFDGGIEVHLDAAGAVYLVQNAYAPGLDLETVPRIPAAAATAAARRHFMTTWQPGPDKSGQPARAAGGRPRHVTATDALLGIVADGAGSLLVWRLQISSEEPVALVRYDVSARDGSIVRAQDLVQSAAEGHGRVFDPNPVVALNDTTLRDLGDANSPSFEAAYLTVPLPGIKRLFMDSSGPYILSGPYVVISDWLEPPYAPLVYSADAWFLFNRDHHGFESAMTYFHIDRNQRYIQSLGFLDVNNRTLRADPHGLGGADNSHYVPLPFGAGFVAFGMGGVDDAEDADVILHEYGHAIQDNQNPARFLPFGETGAMGEGFGDYWAFSNGNQTGFDPACIAEWDFEGTCLRRVDGTKHYPGDLEGEVHADGEIWSSVLHGAFEALGKEKADRIVLESHFLVPPSPRFCDGAHALQQAAASLYGEPERLAEAGAAAARGIAGDLTIASVVGGTTIPPLRFAVRNNGPCAVGPAQHTVQLITGTSETVVATVETQGLGPGEDATFELDLPGADVPYSYRVTVDTGQDEVETDEANNIYVTALQPGGPRVGLPPVIESVDAAASSAEATCDYTAVLQGLLCESGFPIESFVSPFPVLSVTARYTTLALHARVTDPDSTPLLNDVASVTNAFLVEAGTSPDIAFLMRDDGGEESTLGQFGTRPEDCTIVPGGVCSCGPAHFPVTSQDATPGDDVYTLALPLVAIGPNVRSPNALAMLENCVARQKHLVPWPADLLVGHNVFADVTAVDNAGNLGQWTPAPMFTIEPSALICEGDACGCCLLTSYDIQADPANGGCRGLPGLPGIPGSGFENGLCTDLIP